LDVNWFYAIGEDIHGPVSRAELESLFSSGVITINTLVLQEGMYDWIHFVDLKKTTQILPVISGYGSPAPQPTPPDAEHHESAGQDGGGERSSED
jgi:hypothetical protein